MVFNAVGLFHSFFFLSAVAASFFLYLDFIFPKFRDVAYLKTSIILWLLIIASLEPWLMVFLWCLAFVHLLYLLSSTPKSRALRSLFLIFLALPLLVSLAHIVLLSMSTQYPLVYDEYLMAIDGTLGFYPAVFLGRLNQLLPLYVLHVINMLYLALPLILILIFKIRESKEQHPPTDLLMEALFIGVVGFALYSLVPACGSTFAFQSFTALDFIDKKPQLIACGIGYPRNCIPSLHTAWLILLMRHAFGCGGRVRIFMAVVFLANFIAMFGIGAHYLVDIMVGFAFANICGGLFAYKIPLSQAPRWQAIVIGAALVVGWYGLIFYGLTFLQISKLLAWSFFMGSAGLSFWLEYGLIRTTSMRIGGELNIGAKNNMF